MQLLCPYCKIDLDVRHGPTVSQAADLVVPPRPLPTRSQAFASYLKADPRRSARGAGTRNLDLSSLHWHSANTASVEAGTRLIERSSSKTLRIPVRRQEYLVQSQGSQ